jgi:ABC-type multidrug transport system ATPase subunit
MLVKLSSQSRDHKAKARIFKSSSMLKGWTRKAPQGVPMVASLVEVFAAFVSLDEQVDTAEAEVALDLLRHAFPEADHHWLARRLQKALRAPTSTSALASKLAVQLDREGIVSLGLQLYLLINASSRRNRGRRAFLELFHQLDGNGLGKIILQEIEEGYTGTKKLPFTRLICSSNETADVQLPASPDNYAFRVYQAGQVIIIRNTGDQALFLSGSSLIPGGIIRMRSHQRIMLPNWTLSYNDLSFFLNYKRTHQSRALFLHETNSGLVAERSRTRLSTVRVDFGISADVTAIRPGEITLKGLPLEVDQTHKLTFHDHLTLKNGSTVELESIRNQALEAGGRFRLSSEKQTCLVSNDPAVIGKGDLLISPGLAGKITLKITYDPATSVGELEILESERILLMNGQPVRSGAYLMDGAIIRLSASQAVRCRFSEGLIDEERTVIQELHLDGITHSFGRNTTALDSIDFKINRGEMLCIMGPSGCGKSTLLSVIAGQLKPNRGHVRFNGISLYGHRARLAPFIAFMPQEEALNPHLTVREHLTHACTIRRPHLAGIEHTRRVDSILAELALEPLADRKVGSPGDKTISGGERGRLNLGLDLGSAAEIFLFDEPISGLSSKDSEHVAESLRALARDKIVIASLHRPGATVLSLFDKVLLLDKEGKVAFFGTPDDMSRYFDDAAQELHIPTINRADCEHGNINGADFVFDVLETPLHGTIGANESSSFARRFPPTFWQERLESQRLIQKVSEHESQVQTQLGDMPRADDNMPVPTPRPRRYLDHFRLFRAHLSRSFLTKFRNRGTFYCTILEAPLLAALIAITLRASAEGSYAFSSGLHIVTYLFLSVTVAMFLGLTNSATEILRDLPVLRRERNTRYGTGLYITAKCTTLSLLAAIQCAIYVSIGHYFLEIKEMWFSHWLWMSTTAICGTAIAMLISAIVKSERAALSSIPLMLVPQLLLAGALVPYGEMNRGLFVGGDRARDDGAEPVPAMFMPLRYAFEGIVLAQATENPFEKERRRIQARIDQLKEKTIPADDSKEENYLTDAEAERISILTSGLTRLYAAEALDQEGAAELSHKIADLSLFGSFEELEALNIYLGEPDESEPVQSFFQNERAELLVRRSEMNRVDMHSDKDRSLFLAEWKFWFGEKRSSMFWCKSVLLSVTITSLILATLVVTRWNRKVS